MRGGYVDIVFRTSRAVENWNKVSPDIATIAIVVQGGRAKIRTWINLFVIIAAVLRRAGHQYSRINIVSLIITGFQIVIAAIRATAQPQSVDGNGFDDGDRIGSVVRVFLSDVQQKRADVVLCLNKINLAPQTS
jgi:hypothetical protein